MEYKIDVGTAHNCLECGKELNYGRTDRKFCCEDCKNKYHNRKNRNSRITHLRVLSALNRNYEILDKLFKSGVKSIDLIDITTMGFRAEYSTGYIKSGKHQLYHCFEYSYIITQSKISRIDKSIAYQKDNPIII